MNAEEKKARKAANNFALYSTLVIIAMLLVFAGICLGRMSVDKLEIIAPVEAMTKEAAVVAAEGSAVVAAEEIQEAPIQEPVATPVTAEPGLTALGTYKVTHYCPCTKCCGQYANGITATGTTATEGRTVAVDPKVIPYGSQVLVRYADGSEHTYIAEDCGGAIKGNRLDVFMASHDAALTAGVKTAEVFLVGGAA